MNGYLVVDHPRPNSVITSNTHKTLLIDEPLENVFSDDIIQKPSSPRRVVVRTTKSNITVTKQHPRKMVYGSGPINFIIGITEGDVYVDTTTGNVFVYYLNGNGSLLQVHIGQFTEDGGRFGYTFGNVAPVSPSLGDIWLDSSSGSLFTYVSSGAGYAWAEMCTSSGLHTNDTILISDTPPTNPSVSDIWFDTMSGGLMIYINDGTDLVWVDYTE